MFSARLGSSGRLKQGEMKIELAEYPFVSGSLVNSGQADMISDRFPAYESALSWMRDFVARPDSRINRPGAVCPRLAPAFRQDLIWCVSIELQRWTVDETVAKGIHLADLYFRLFPDPQQFKTGSLLGLLPGLPPGRAAEIVDEGHRRLRMDFVSRGLMLGEFHPRSQVVSVRNPEFLVMRSPVPMFAVRALTVHDLMFLDTPQTDPIDRLQYFKHYLDHLGGQLSPSARDRVHLRIQKAEGEL
ncbi:DUF6875 domain-containing protein [Amycolatopsis sp. NPDC088138]|uniref:DUF6875 domain-containing protein n=1 Tax=Amycolatopsis sp. NPDC088138 TaxID=3363938 RepID=UPI003817E994